MINIRKNTVTVYLAGGINGLSDADAKDWRETVKERLATDKRFVCLDPMRRDYRGKEAANVKAIVEGDIEDIRSSDVIIAMCPKPSWGTAMEIRLAWTFGKRIISVVPSLVPLSPWLAYHTEPVISLDEAIIKVL